MFVYIKKLFDGCQHIDEEIVDDEIAFDKKEADEEKKFKAESYNQNDKEKLLTQNDSLSKRISINP